MRDIKYFGGSVVKARQKKCLKEYLLWLKCKSFFTKGEPCMGYSSLIKLIKQHTSYKNPYVILNSACEKGFFRRSKNVVFISSYNRVYKKLGLRTKRKGIFKYERLFYIKHQEIQKLRNNSAWTDSIYLLEISFNRRKQHFKQEIQKKFQLLLYHFRTRHKDPLYKRNRIKELIRKMRSFRVNDYRSISCYKIGELLGDLSGMFGSLLLRRLTKRKWIKLSKGGVHKWKYTGNACDNYGAPTYETLEGEMVRVECSKVTIRYCDFFYNKQNAFVSEITPYFPWRNNSVNMLTN